MRISEDGVFRRKIYDKLLTWKKQSRGSTALLVEGARRVGKSTTVEEFAKKEYRSYILIDFAEAPLDVHRLFDDVSDLNYLFLQLQLRYQQQLHERESLIIFDEVQLCPLARQAIKTLVKDGRYDYIETGSLISIRKNTAGILIPSEEQHVQMQPMDFEEFRWACGDEATIPLLQSAFATGAKLGDDLNRKLMRDFRLYMLVGGMPQAVNAYLNTNNLQAVDDVKRTIINLYEEDFYKLNPSGALSMLFDAIPAQLANKSSRFHVSSVLANRQASDILEELAELRESKTVLMAYHANDPNVGMSSSVDLEKFKLYLADTGLFVTLMFKDANFTDNLVYEKLLADKLPVNLGMVYENVVAQELTAKGYGLFYHTWPKERSNHNYEIDFILPDGKKICPIEVKASRYKTHASLDAFCKKFSSRVGKQYLVYTKDMRKDGEVTCIPTYMARFL
ncbi:MULTISPECIES: ATP-binding protein [Enorma]|uniref:ATP-binding protein n=1 Tax=Enorma TaxID=1472762 RepID=UPI00036BEEA4|nr:MULTISPECIES: AAA family ATPase [Enorma]